MRKRARNKFGKFKNRCPKERFWEKVDKQSPNDCWEWTGSLNHNYGVFWDGKKRVRAHRYSFFLKYGHYPKKGCACHACDNPSCVNPDHLWDGTLEENFKDMRNKGRGTKPPTHNGQKNPSAKLTQEQVLEIRKQYELAKGEKGTQTQLAKKYGVNKTMISNIVRWKNWKSTD